MIESSPPPPFVPEAASAAMWPSIQESKIMTLQAKEEDWEFVDTAEDEQTNNNDTAATNYAARHLSNSSSSSKGLFHKTMSTPDLGHYECYSEERSSTPSDTETDDLLTCATSVMSTDPPLLVKSLPIAGDEPVQIVRKPSFKDAILLNAQETASEEADKKNLALKQHQQRVMNRTRVKPKFVVQTMKRCSRSTGDLTSLATIQDDVEEDCAGGGGRGLATVPAEEVLGATDAEEFYARKKHGGEARKNSLKLRPDEAKRKEFSLYKREMQRNNNNN